VGCRFYLEIDHPSQLRLDYAIFHDDDIDADDLDDISQLPHPERFTRELLLNDVHTRVYAVGRVELGRYDGRKVVIEQNASPLLVYWKGVMGGWLRVFDERPVKLAVTPGWSRWRL
jgi:hypothetical protein